MKNKILSILCIFILITCCFINNNVFASLIYNDYDFSDAYNHIPLNSDGELCPYIIYKSASSDNIYLYFSSEASVNSIWRYLNAIMFSVDIWSQRHEIVRYVYNFDTGVFEYSTTYVGNNRYWSVSRKYNIF